MLMPIHLNPVTVLLPLLIAGAALAAAPGPQPEDGPGFAVVELFTSESCSSCPPAEALVQKLREEYAGKDVFLLAFHVDYWNHLDWRDPFSDKKYTDRQREYARAFGSGRIYTPQMVVNGHREFVGSDRNKAVRAIQQALSGDNAHPLSIQLETMRDRGKLRVSWKLESSMRGKDLHLALVENGLRRHIRSGENAGRRLLLDCVVRAFASQKLNKEMQGMVVLALPEGINADSAAVIAFVQERRNMRVLGAAREPLR